MLKFSRVPRGNRIIIMPQRGPAPAYLHRRDEDAGDDAFEALHRCCGAGVVPAMRAAPAVKAANPRVPEQPEPRQRFRASLGEGDLLGMNFTSPAVPSSQCVPLYPLPRFNLTLKALL